MRLAVINKKGGTGKTAIAMSLAIDLQMEVATNDASALGVFAGKKEHHIGKNFHFLQDSMMKNFKMGENSIFDFGGRAMSATFPILEQCDKIIIPCSAESTSAMVQTISTLIDLKSLREKIVIVITMYEKESEFKELKEEFSQNFNNIPIFGLRRSKIFHNVTSRGKGICELCEESKISQYSYRNICQEYQTLLDFIKNTNQ